MSKLCVGVGVGMRIVGSWNFVVVVVVVGASFFLSFFRLLSFFVFVPCLSFVLFSCLT